MTIDPNATLSELRCDLDGADDFDNYGPNATLALKSTRRLLAHLDAGGPLPDAWTPFYTPAAALNAALDTIAQAVDHDAQGQPITHDPEPDPRSIAGDLRAALGAWGGQPIDRRNETDAERMEEIGDDLANAAQALLDCQPDEHQPTHLEMAEQLRLTRRGNEQLVQRRQADMDTIDRLTHDLAHANNTIAQRDARIRNLIQQRDQHAATIEELRAALDTKLAFTDSGHDAAYALVARAAAHIADGIEGSARDLRQHATSQIALGGNTGTPDNKQRARTTIAAMLAVGAARHGANRKSSDLAERTAGYLEAIADTLS